MQKDMKYLYLIRHAKSSWDNLEISDVDRPLNERGLRDAPYMGKRLKEKEVAPDLMLSSPAKRAIATCRQIAAIIGHEASRIKTDPRLYHASEETLVSVLSGLSDSHHVAMLFGHNPGLTRLTNSIFGQHIMNIPTCGIVAGKLNIGTWGEVKAGCGRLGFFDFPKKNKRKG